MITLIRYLVHGWFHPVAHHTNQKHIDKIMERAEVHMVIPQQRRSPE